VIERTFPGAIDEPQIIARKSWAERLRRGAQGWVGSGLRGWPESRQVVLVCAAAFVALLAYELRTSALQSQVMSMLASRLTWQIAPGPSERLVVPREGPFDIVRGYTRIPDFRHRLEGRGFRVAEQSRFSPPLAFATTVGVTPPSHERAVTGLVIRGRDGTVLYDASAGKHRFERYEDIPPVLVSSLLMMEDRQLQRVEDARANAAVDWGRFTRAALFSVGSRLGLPLAFQGGSTLAVQMEKYRHSENGRTSSLTDKLRQMFAASLKLYRDGPDTRDEQRQIVLDYFNSVPLGGAPGYGEVQGIGEGLRAWFGLDPKKVFAILAKPDSGAKYAFALKHVLALLCAVRAPTRMLGNDQAELARRVALYERRLAEKGLLNVELAAHLAGVPIQFGHGKSDPAMAAEQRKAVDAVRRELMRLLGVRDFYELDRLDLEVETSFGASSQRRAIQLFRRFEDPEYVMAQGLNAPRLLASGDPGQVSYTLLMFERDDDSDEVLVRADNLDQPFDLNSGMRMELGSTAKLRTLAHYLEVVERIHREISRLDATALEERAVQAPDPLTRWVAAERLANPDAPLDTLLEHAMERRFRANPHEAFFTGGGLHIFSNFDPDDDGRILSVRQAFVRSNNLVFVRVMRELVRYHEARLPLRADLADAERRRRVLVEEADREAKIELKRAYEKLRAGTTADLPLRLLGPEATVRDLAVLYFAWHPGAPADSLPSWLSRQGAVVEPDVAQDLIRAYGGELGLLDYAYLLDRHPLELWCAIDLAHHPEASWEDVVARSAGARQECQNWLLETKNRRAQDLRLRARVEREAFVRMTQDWQRLGFPFKHLVPSLATALGSSADRPEALAGLMGIIVADGLKRPKSFLRKLRFGPGSPYETTVEPVHARGERVMAPEVAGKLREALAEVVERGTARRMLGAVQDAQGEPMQVGGKTGSGDNRVDAVASNGVRLRSRTVSRTAAFVFYVGDRWYGVVTATVPGRKASHFEFTSALPLEVLKRFAPQVEATAAAVTRSGDVVQ
jgi:membrane peptidoglycan carboxypeptidase